MPSDGTVDPRRDAVITIIRSIVGKRETIDTSTRLYHDLRIISDDAWELLTEIHQKFGTSFKAMDFEAYWPDGFDQVPFWLLELLGFNKKAKAITFGHLLKVVEAGHWYEP
jgi:hypothetical protein